MGERTVAVVMINGVFTVVRNKQIQVAVIVVVTYADTLAPTPPRQARSHGHIGECAVAIVLVKVVRRLLAFGKVLEPPAIDQKDVEPAVVIVIKEGCTTAGCGKEEILCRMALDHGPRGQPGALCDVNVPGQVLGLAG